MMSDSKEPAHRARAAAIEATIAERLTAFDRHGDDLLDLLQKCCERRPKTKSFDLDKSWRRLRHMARRYLEMENEARAKPPADRVELLHEFGKALRKAHRKFGGMMRDDIRGYLFVEWCEAHGKPDFTDPIIGLFEKEFEKVVAGVVAGLAALETAASRAAEQVRQKRGRPGGTSVLPHDFVIGLESTYRDITGKAGRVGWGPFAQFVEKFLEAVGRESNKESIIRLIKAVKQREQKDPATSRWGREDPAISRWKRALRARVEGEISPKSS
jgi:hypothetical protein